MCFPLLFFWQRHCVGNCWTGGKWVCVFVLSVQLALPLSRAWSLTICALDVAGRTCFWAWSSIDLDLGECASMDWSCIAGIVSVSDSLGCLKQDWWSCCFRHWLQGQWATWPNSVHCVGFCSTATPQRQGSGREFHPNGSKSNFCPRGLVAVFSSLPINYPSNPSLSLSISSAHYVTNWITLTESIRSGSSKELPATMWL